MISPSRPLSLAVVLHQMVQDQSLSPTKRRDIASAFRTVGKALNRELHDIPADPRILRARLREVSPMQAGLSRSRWANVRSLVGRALTRAGIVALPGRRLTPLTPAWQNLYSALPTKSLRTALSRFMGYCAGLGVDPNDVDDASADEFLRVLENESVIKKPRTVHRCACRAWNLARERVQAWPRQTLTVPSYRTQYALAWNAFPESLCEEIEQWLSALSGQDLLAENAPSRPLRPATIRTRRDQLNWYASALVQRGRDPGSLRTLAELVDIGAIKEGLRFLLERRGGTPTRHLQNIVDTLRAAARWIGADPKRIAEISVLSRRLNSGTKGLTAKNRATLRQFDDPRNVEALLALPRRLLACARRRPGQPASLPAAIDVQVAVAIELLLVAPVRIGNLVSVSLGQNLLTVGRNGQQHLVFPSGEVKNEADLEFPLPTDTSTLLNIYCREFRPMLGTGANDFLFPAPGGLHKRSGTLADQIKSRVLKYTGLRVTPHQFRHVGAKIYLDANPGGYEVVRRVLGHRDGRTTATFYCGLESAAAVRHYDQEILRLRSGTAEVGNPSRHPRGRRAIIRRETP